MKCAFYYSGCVLGQPNKHYLCVWVCARVSLYVYSEGILLRLCLQLGEIAGMRLAAAAIGLPDRPAPA